MHQYRVYLLDENNNNRDAEWMFSDTLEAVVEQVTVEFQDRRCEIWEGAQCVAKVPVLTFETSAG